MRKATISISERDLIFCIAGQIYEQAPSRLPRKANDIMLKVREKIRHDFYNDNEHYSMMIESNKFYKYVEEMLKSIPEFQELNLSQVEFEKGVSVDDESRGKYAFTSRYDVYTDESWKTDFIDLDALINNVVRRYHQLNDADDDCFCCIHENGSKETCEKCTINPNFNHYYECERLPKGTHKFACKHDCFKHYYICCEECKSKETCEHKCDGKSETCGNAINRIKEDK